MDYEKYKKIDKDKSFDPPDGMYFCGRQGGYNCEKGRKNHGKHKNSCRQYL